MNKLLTDTNPYPLPWTAAGGYAVYELNDGQTAQVSRKSDGSFYCAAADFDAEAKNESEMILKLKSFGATYIGWETR